jgi:hypothetical protein
MARATLIDAAIVAVHASLESGLTIPDVPRIEMPPTMPRREFKVFPASDVPRGTEIVT